MIPQSESVKALLESLSGLSASLEVIEIKVPFEYPMAKPYLGLDAVLAKNKSLPPA
jgi:hypothetical protein